VEQCNSDLEDHTRSLTKRYEHTMACYGHVLCNKAVFLHYLRLTISILRSLKSLSQSRHFSPTVHYNAHNSMLPRPPQSSANRNESKISYHVSVTSAFTFQTKSLYVHAVFSVCSSCPTQRSRSPLFLSHRCTYLLKTWDPPQQNLGHKKQDQY
jgi:hypothetical protein